MTVTKTDHELAAMEKIINALEPLDHRARQRIVTYVCSYLDDEERKRDTTKKGEP